MIDDEADQIPKPEGMLSLELKQKRLQAEGKDLYGREAYELQFLSIRWIDKKMIRERQKKREAQLALRERWKNSVKVDEKKAEMIELTIRRTVSRLPSLVIRRPRKKGENTTPTARIAMATRADRVFFVCTVGLPGRAVRSSG